MSKKEIIVLFSILFLIGSSIAVPAFLWFRTYFSTLHAPIDSEKLADLATFQSFIVSFWALLLNAVVVYFAYKAFKHFGVKEQFHQKQFEAVTKLTAEMANTEIKTELHLVAEKMVLKYDFGFFTFIELGFFNNSTCIVIDANSPEQIFSFLKYSKNPLLPSKIAETLNLLSKWNGSGYLSNKLENGNVLILKKDTDIQEDILIYYFDNPVEFQEIAKKIKGEISSWLQNYGATDLNI